MISSDTIAALQTGSWSTEFRTKGYLYPITILLRDDQFIFKFKYNKNLINVVKNRFDGRRWNPEGKYWHAPITERNLFQMDFLAGNNPYANWEKIENHRSKIIEHCRLREIAPLPHQLDMVNLGLSNRRVMWAADMGLGKTLSAILAAEIFNQQLIWWVAPKGPLNAAKIEFRKWQTPIHPITFTYQGLVKHIKTYNGIAPRVLIVDESSYCKNDKSQRTQAVKHVAESMREEYGFDCLILLLTGTPAPKKPTDWFAQCEIIQPGFITEGNIYALNDRLGLWQDSEAYGGKELVTWFDSEDKCLYCGQTKGHINHTDTSYAEKVRSGAVAEKKTHESHKFKAAKNEVKAFGGRLKGLVGVWKKEDCVDLPPRQYHMHRVEPSQEILNIAKQIVATEVRAVDALTKLRTLSDGFIYKTIETGEHEPCTVCTNGKVQIDLEGNLIDCQLCNGTSKIPLVERVFQEYACPKLDLVGEMLECYYETQRFVIYAAYHGSIDLVTRRCLKKGWSVFRADGRGKWRWFVSKDKEYDMSAEEMLERFQSDVDERVAFVGHAGSAGTGLTLHKSLGLLFYSCDFVPQNRLQATDRVHRLGMDAKGGQIHDVIHLPSDEKVIRSLIQSRNLSEMTMSELKQVYNV